MLIVLMKCVSEPYIQIQFQRAVDITIVPSFQLGTCHLAFVPLLGGTIDWIPGSNPGALTEEALILSRKTLHSIFGVY